MGTTFVVAIFYCLEALHSERRDRSILFWKSLPLSDTTTVLAKASVPVIVLPLITFAITIAMQWIMVLLDSAVMMASGLSAASLWAHSPVFATWMPLLYHLLAIHGLWFAPIYGWLLLISAWAKRLAFLWAFLPFVAIGAIEKLAFNTTHFAGMLGELLGGGPDSGALTGGGPMHPLSNNIGQLVVSPGLWIGLTFTAACLAGAVWLRRSQRPI
jgi:ABC-2 type transport system permease protein